MFRFAKEPFVCQVVVSWNHLRDARLFSSSVETRRKSLASPLADWLSIPFICGLFPFAHDHPAQKITLPSSTIIKRTFDATFVTITSRDSTDQDYSPILLLQTSR